MSDIVQDHLQTGLGSLFHHSGAPSLALSDGTVNTTTSSQVAIHMAEIKDRNSASTVWRASVYNSSVRAERGEE
jgi:hypothetical protein